MKVRFAVTPPAIALEEQQFPDYLEAIEQLGFDTLWLSDLPLGALGDPIIALAFAAARTSRIKLGANIVPLGRNPLWLAKQLAQIDRLSNGRLLISLVPGLGQPAERAALGYESGHRSRAIEATMELMRRWWAGDSVSAQFAGFRFEDARVEPRPRQQPLEIWLGGKSGAAIDRVARCADGWLTASMTPEETAVACAVITQRAADYGRRVDREHFGISIPYSRERPSDEDLAATRARRGDRDESHIVAVGAEGLGRLAQAHVAAGLSKFVVRPLNPLADPVGWQSELVWLADVLLPLQEAEST